MPLRVYLLFGRNEYRTWRMGLCVRRGKCLVFVRGNFSNRKLVPFIERGPFGCWDRRWRWGKLSWSLERWR